MSTISQIHTCTLSIMILNAIKRKELIKVNKPGNRRHIETHFDINQ